MRPIKRKILFIASIIVGFLFMMPVIQDQAQGQYSGQPGSATLEEQLELAKEKLRQAESEATTNTQPSQSQSDLANISAQKQFTQEEWKTFICPRCGLSLEYPPTVPGGDSTT